jgi:hypothetical protein
MSAVTNGLGVMTPPLLFMMRAYRTTPPGGYIYWEVEDAPDITAAQAPIPAIELTDIVTSHAYPQQAP